MGKLILLLTTVLYLSFAQIKLISPKELQNLIGKEDVVILDLRKSIKEYWKGHIPGAQWVSVEAFRFPERGTPAFFLNVDLFTKKLALLGIDKDTKVVLYDDKGSFIPFYVAWGLDYINHKHIYVLEGGINRYKAEGYKLTKDYPKIKPKENYGDYKIKEDLRADLEEVKKAINSKEYLIIDARPEELYKGKKGFWKRLGHIKGAKSRFWRLDFEEVKTKDGLTYLKLRSKDEISLFYESLGLDKDKKVIVYCGQGLMAGASYFILKYYLKITEDVRLYDGSWNEYSQTSLPAER